MQETKSSYFTTGSGNVTLLGLTKFEEGHKILYKILRTAKLPISLYYMDRFRKPDYDLMSFVDPLTVPLQSLATRVPPLNVLTSLIMKQNMDLYDLLFNRALLYLKESSTGGYSVLNDVFITLQNTYQIGILMIHCYST